MVLKKFNTIAQDLFREDPLFITRGVHKMKTIAAAVEVLQLPFFQQNIVKLVGGLERPLQDLLRLDILQFDPDKRAALARLDMTVICHQKDLTVNTQTRPG